MDNKEYFKKIYRDLLGSGTFVKPRGQLVREIENYSYKLPPYVRFQSFKSRKLNIDYIKSEMLWYLKGDKFDLSILEKASLWKSLVNKDGSINSNYGQYWFASPQFDNVVKILSEDKDSRRAYMTILSDFHLLSMTNDVPCTIAIGFRIRPSVHDSSIDVLNMSVAMRSQDVIFGMGNDAPAFSFIHEMMLQSLRRKYPALMCGSYFHTADSFHVYERHFEMLEKLAGDDEYEEIKCPRISSPDEVDFLRKLNFSSVPEHFAFTRWLLNINQ